ncbi:MAG: hypothetical protein HY038_08785 [Nitrospirae bacterium]|nr:hypothetical protein [Nitrospirota bacterium]
MAPVLELDKQTASFVRQLEEQRKLEKNLLVERVRGTKEGADSAFSDIKNRVALLEKLNGSASASCIAPIGWSKLIFTGSESVSDPNTIGFGDRDESLCKLDQIRYLEDTHYLRLSANPYYVEYVLPNKSAQARVGANTSLWDTLGYVHVGYGSVLSIPAALEPTTVSIMSRLNTLFNWVEANAVGDEWYAHVSATARLWATYDGEFRQAPPAQFVNLLATPKRLRTHQDIASPAPSAALTMQVSASAGSGTTISVYESIELVATTPNGHAYVDGVFSWEPLAVQLREG